MSQAVVKVCTKCGKNVAGEKRVKDPQGRYYCAKCFELLKAAPAIAAAPAPAIMPPPDEGEFDLAPIVEAPKPVRSPPAGAKAPLMSAMMTGPACPCCSHQIVAGGKICVGCGIHVPSGRPVVTSLGRDLDQLHANAEAILRVLAWILRIGLYPIASEASGFKKPIVIWVVAAATTLFSLCFIVAYNHDKASVQNLMLWPSTPELTDAQVLKLYHDRENEPLGRTVRSIAEEVDAKQLSMDQKIVASYRALQDFAPHGEFHWYQLFTNTLLHDPDSIWGFIMHLGGNMLFLLIFGTRVNALIGNLKMAILYPVLAVLASAAHLAFTHDVVPTPALGASGAIMGLAGMYLIFFPVQRVYMAFFLKIFWRIPTWIKIWPVRGFWVLAFYLSFDIVATLLRSEDGVAHWAHLGGFICGMIIALAMLIFRTQDAQGNLLTVIFGKAAWPLVGRPTPMLRSVVVG